MEPALGWVCLFTPGTFVFSDLFLFSVMRKDAVYTLLLNVTLFSGMRCTLAQDPRYLRFTAIEEGVVTTYNLKVNSPEFCTYIR
jgi:hypothetical protein